MHVTEHFPVFSLEAFQIPGVHMSVSTYKIVNYVVIYCNLKLNRDIEKNPGPVDDNKTICVPNS